MTFPKKDHPLYCPQSNGPKLREGCPRCGRIVATRESMGGHHDVGPFGGTLLPHLRYRWNSWHDREDARLSRVSYIVEPHNHGGRSKVGAWQVVHVRYNLGVDGRPDEVVAVFPTIAEAFAEQDRLNGWPIVDGLDLAAHLAEMHGRWYDFAPGGLAIDHHNAYHGYYQDPHVHQNGAVVRLVPAG